MVGHEVGQVRARPVEGRHEVVGYAADAAGREVPQRLFIMVDIDLEVTRLCLDMLVDGDTLDNAPGQTGFSNQLLPTANFINGPHLAVGDMVQGVNDIGSSSLPDVPEGDRVGWTVPTPGLFTQIHVLLRISMHNPAF